MGSHNGDASALLPVQVRHSVHADSGEGRAESPHSALSWLRRMGALPKLLALQSAALALDAAARRHQHSKAKVALPMPACVAAWLMAQSAVLLVCSWRTTTAR